MTTNRSVPALARRYVRGRRRLALFRRGIGLARNMEDLRALERWFGPIDEEEPGAEDLCYQLRAAACYLSGGPAPARERFTLLRPLPDPAHRSFRVKGRIGARIAAVVWADGRLYGSLYALARLEARPADDSDPKRALARILAAFDAVSEAPENGLAAAVPPAGRNGAHHAQGVPGMTTTPGAVG